jgi:hypothetical protein
MTVVWLGAVVVSGGAVAGVLGGRAQRTGSYQPGTHAARNDAIRDPIGRRVRQGYGSVEIGVWLDRGTVTDGSTPHDRLLVAEPVGPDGAIFCDPSDPGAELDRLVLRPLASRVAEYGGVYADSDDAVPFRLMINVLNQDDASQERAHELLEDLLARYPGVFTRIVDRIVLPGPVTVILTGDDVPRAVLAGQVERSLFACGTFADLGPWGAPPTLAPLLHEHWSWRFEWRGRGELSSDEREELHRLVTAAHGEGRQVCFSGVPRGPWRVRMAFWCELAAAGVDLVTTAQPSAFATFRRGYGTPTPILATTYRRGVRREIAVPAATAHVPEARRPERAAGREFRGPAVLLKSRKRPATPARHRVVRSSRIARAGTR